MTNGIGKTNACLKIITASLCLLVFSFKPAFAQTDLQVSPPQAICITPTGARIVTYLDGTHGIAGDLATFTGKDEVFALGNDDALQCFCATDGSGVDTIWWSSFPQDKVDELTASGWIFVPNGSLWGLAAKPYLAKNTNYTCSTDTKTGTGGTSSNDSGQVLGSTLAATGGKGTLLGLIYASVALFLAGIFLKFKSSKNSRSLKSI